MGDLENLVMAMSNCEATMLAEIADTHFKRKDIASTYGLSIHAGRYGEVIDWKKVNAAIVARWSKSGLDYVKKLAWKRSEGIQ